jgi:hypothetical protein
MQLVHLIQISLVRMGEMHLVLTNQISLSSAGHATNYYSNFIGKQAGI